MATGKPHLDDVTRLSDRVIRILGGNPGKFTLQGTNTYLVGKGPSRVLIDTGEANRPEWVQRLKDVLTQENATLSTVLITHWHPDHVGGVPDILTFNPKPQVHKNTPERLSTHDISDGQIFRVDSETTLRAFHSPGHTADHMAFVLEEEDAMFTGDNVLGHGTAVFEDLSTYLDTLASMSRQVKGRGYPGHGQFFESCPARIQEYIVHRERREREVLDVLSGGRQGSSTTSSSSPPKASAGTESRTTDGMECMDIVKVIYKDVPESLHLAASRGIVQILDKLVEEGKVIHDEEKGTWRMGQEARL